VTGMIAVCPRGILLRIARWDDTEGAAKATPNAVQRAARSWGVDPLPPRRLSAWVTA